VIVQNGQINVDRPTGQFIARPPYARAWPAGPVGL